MRNKNVVVIVLVGAVVLGGCVTLTPDEQKAACRESGLEGYRPRNQMPSASQIGCGNANVLWYQRNQIRQVAQQFEELDKREADASAQAEADRQRSIETQKAALAQAQKKTEETQTSSRYIHRRTETFTSLQDAISALSPMDYSSAAMTVGQNPMGLKGQPITLIVEILQKIDDDQMLADPCFIFHMGHSCPVYLLTAKNVGGFEPFVDGQKAAVVAEVVNTHTYMTTLGAQKTVPSLLVYAIEPQRGF